MPSAHLNPPAHSAYAHLANSSSSPARVVAAQAAAAAPPAPPEPLIGGPVTKLSCLTERWSCGDRLGALRIAAKFPRLGEHHERITRGWAAHTNPDFYASMGENPHELVADGLLAVAERYGLDNG